MSQQPLWIPPNYGAPSTRQFSLIAWIAGQFGLFMVARWVGLGCFVLAHLVESFSQQDVDKIGQAGAWICLILGSAWIQRESLIRKGLTIPYWISAAGMYSMIAIVGLLLSHYPKGGGITEDIAFMCFWLGLTFFQAVVLWEHHKQFATHWLLIGVGATLIGILLGMLVNLVFFSTLISGSIYIIGTGVLTKHYRLDRI